MIIKNLSSKQIEYKRKQVRDELYNTSQNIKSGEIQAISEIDLKTLFQIYDNIFLDGHFQTKYKGTMRFALSRQLRRSAGITKFSKNMSTLKPDQYHFEIKISTDFIFNYNQIDRDKIVNGIKTHDQLDAMMLVFEHELCHVIEFICFLETSCKKDRFKGIAKKLFGHTDIYHALPTIGEINFNEYGFKPGDKVSFEHRGKIICGTINRISKRATIMSKNKTGIYVDKDGCKYNKYLVPQNLLIRS
jgi:hypothetical protein